MSRLRSTAHALVFSMMWSAPALSDVHDKTGRPVMLTSIDAMDEVYTELQTIYNDIQTAERQINKAEVILIEAMGGTTGMGLTESIAHFRSEKPAELQIVLEGSLPRVVLGPEPSPEAQTCALQLTEAIELLQTSKLGLSQIPPRLTVIQPHLVRFSREAPAAGREAGHGTRERLELVRKVEANQATAADLPRRTAQAVKDANLTLHRIKSLTD
jgi:hypothetical protein